MSMRQNQLVVEGILIAICNDYLEGRKRVIIEGCGIKILESVWTPEVETDSATSCII